MRSAFSGPEKADFSIPTNGDCEKTIRTISKIPKDSERSRASPGAFFSILVSRVREVVVSQHFRNHLQTQNLSEIWDFFFFGTGDCEKTTRTISKIPKDSERSRASPKILFFILVSEFGKWLFHNILEVVF